VKGREQLLLSRRSRGRAWGREQTAKILAGKHRDALAGADECAHYLENKRDYHDYLAFLAAGWPVASGLIEGAAHWLGPHGSHRRPAEPRRRRSPSFASAPSKATAISTTTSPTTSPSRSSATTTAATSSLSPPPHKPAPPEMSYLRWSRTLPGVNHRSGRLVTGAGSLPAPCDRLSPGRKHDQQISRAGGYLDWPPMAVGSLSLAGKHSPRVPGVILVARFGRWDYGGAGWRAQRALFGRSGLLSAVGPCAWPDTDHPIRRGDRRSSRQPGCRAYRRVRARARRRLKLLSVTGLRQLPD